MTIGVDEDLAALLCPYCRFALGLTSTALACPSCGTPHHPDCWTDNGRCAVSMCEIGLEAPTHLPPPPPPGSRPMLVVRFDDDEETAASPDDGRATARRLLPFVAAGLVIVVALVAILMVSGVAGLGAVLPAR